MSILIKGMEMPTSCAECLNIGFHYVFECVLDDVEHGERRADCPLVSVPPHGRLIDADALKKDGWELFKWVGFAIHEMPLNNPSIPTIIEAEVDDV